jgi:hypothetical protein
VRCPWLQAETKVATIGPSGVRALPLAAGRNEGGHYFGQSGVRALPLAAGINEGGHYFGPSGVRALPLAAGINEGGHYFRYFSFSCCCCSYHRYSKPQKGLS